MKKELIIITLTSIIILSCSKISKELNLEYQSCINNQIINNFSYKTELYKNHWKFPGEDFNVFDSLMKYEKFLLDEKILKNTKEKGYSNLISTVGNINNPSKLLNRIYKENPFIEHMMHGDISNFSVMIHQCTRILYEKNLEEFRSHEYIAISDLIIANGGIPTLDILEKLSKEIDYSDNIQRLQLSYYIIDNLKYRNDKQK